MNISLTKQGKKAVALIARDNDGNTLHRTTIAPDSPQSRAAACRLLKIDDALLLSWLDGLDRSPDDPRRFSTTLNAPTVARRAIQRLDRIGGRVIETHDADALTVLKATLGNPAESLLRWQDSEYLCCLDVDYHGHTPPRRELIELWADRLAPTPVAYHASRGGGLHAFYIATPPFTARQLAAAAALKWLTVDPTAGVELKTQVRCAGDATVVYPCNPDTAGTLSSWLGCDVADPEAVAAWMDENDMRLGQRYPHDRCPIDPTDSSDRDPVVVGEAGVYCHRCAGKGLGLGSRSAGFAPFAALVSSPSAGEVGRMVRNKVHWGHAKVVLTERYGMPESLAKDAYAAALTAYHPDDPTVSFAFHPDTEAMVRSNDSWMDLSCAYTFPLTHITPLLSAFPSALTVDDKGKAKPIASTVSRLMQGNDLSAFGYSNIQAIHGPSLARPFLPPAQRTVKPVVAPELVSAGSKWLPRYVPVSKRTMTTEAAWGEIEFFFPRINRDLVRGLICAVGSAQETRLGLHPFIFIAGTSASAKTMTTMIASAILGTRSAAVTYSSDEAKLRQAIKEGAVKSSIVRADELLKESKRAMGSRDWSPKKALDGFLTLTPDTMCHVLYVGSRRLGMLPPVVITETLCPHTVKDYTQIARRLRFVQLHGSKRDWKDRMALAGITGETIVKLRLVNERVNHACDVILSDVVDEFFAVPMTWDAQADKCNIPTIEDSLDFDNPVPQLLRFYQLLCQAPPQADKHATRHKATDGWRRICKHEIATPDAQELLDLFDHFSDEQGVRWGQSTVLQEKAWGDLLSVDHPVILDIHSEGGSTAYVRFRVGQPHRIEKTNGQIKNPSEIRV